MRKALVISAVTLSLLGGAAGTAAWILRRPVRGGPPEDEGAQSIQANPAGAGMLLEIQAGGLPLRSLRWIGPLAGGVVVAQVATQSDRHQVAVFKEGKPVGLFPVPRPAGIGEGLFNHAELVDAAFAENETLVLLYRPLGGAEGDPGMVLALDLATRNIRWCHRAPGERLASAGSGKEGAVFLFGGTSPIQRLPLALQRGEAEGISPTRPNLKPFEHPGELGVLTQLQPTGAWTFLVAHTKGLSAYNGSVKGWTHVPSPKASRLGYTEPKGAITSAASGYWWQPEPGVLLPVQADGNPVPGAEALEITLADPALDGSMLRLLGSDGEAQLWFALAVPTLRPLPTPAPAPASPAGSEGVTPPEAEPAEAPTFTSEELLAWENHVRSGLDRIYRFDPVKKTLQRIVWTEAWSGLRAPDGFTRPTREGGLQPSRGGALFASDRGAWWLPLGALPLKLVEAAIPAGSQVKAAPTPTAKQLD